MPFAVSVVSNVRPLLFASLLAVTSLALPAIARADCSVAPLGSTDDLVVSFLAAQGGTQAAASTQFASPVKEGMLVYDDTTNALRYCDGTNWVSLVGSGGGAGATAAGTGSEVQFRNISTGAFNADTNFVWDNTNKRLGIGTATPLTPLHLNDGNTPDASLITTDKLLFSYEGTAPGFTGLAASNSSALHRPVFKGTRARGTLAAPTAVANNDDIFTVMSVAYDGTTPQGTAGVFFKADGNASSGVAPQRISFVTSETDAAARTEKLTIKANGDVGIGTTSPASKLHIAGGMQLGDDTATCPGAGNVKLGTLRFNAGSLNVCLAGGWTALTTGGSALAAGSTGQIQFNGGSGVFAADAALHWDNTNKRLGIGTASPLRLLHLSSAAPELVIEETDQAAGSKVWRHFAASARYYFQACDDAMSSCSVSPIVMDRTGLVGINVTPTETLDINGAIRSRVGDGPVMFFRETVGTGAATTDGARMAYEENLFGANQDGLVFEKTDLNAAQPDGGIMFANRGNDNVRVPILAIRGSGNVGIGTTTPSSKLEIAGQDGLAITGYEPFITLRDTNASNLRALVQNKAGDLYLVPNSFIGGTPPVAIKTSTGNVGIGTSSPGQKLDVNGTIKATAITLNGAATTAILHATAGTGTTTIQGTNTGTSYGIYCNASLCGGSVGWTNTSDLRLKERIETLGSREGLDTVLRLRPVAFHWKDKNRDEVEGRKLGLIAQEVEEVVPEIVHAAGDEAKTKSIAYSDLVPVLVRAIQDLKADNDNLRDALKAANDNQASEIRALREEINALKARP